MVVFTESHKILSMNLTIKFKQFLKQAFNSSLNFIRRLFADVAELWFGGCLADVLHRFADGVRLGEIESSETCSGFPADVPMLAATSFVEETEYASEVAADMSAVSEVAL